LAQDYFREAIFLGVQYSWLAGDGSDHR